jgi:hypothetical protein
VWQGHHSDPWQRPSILAVIRKLQSFTVEIGTTDGILFCFHFSQLKLSAFDVPTEKAMPLKPASPIGLCGGAQPAFLLSGLCDLGGEHDYLILTSDVPLTYNHLS